MKKLLYILLALLLIIASILYLGNRYLNSGSIEPDNSVWNEHIGRDTTVGLWPDKYANYFSYTFVRTDENIGIKIKGQFADARYMSFNVYNLEDKSTQGSIIDSEILTDSGNPNPTLDGSPTGEEQYTIHVIPEKYKDADLPNKLVFRDDSKILLIVIRYYDFNQDDYAGVPLPTTQAFELNESQIEPVNLPLALNLKSMVDGPKIAESIWFMYDTENLEALDGPKTKQQYYSLPFFRVIGEGMIQNYDNLYLLSAVTKKEDEVYVMKFKAPTFVKTAEDIGKADVRYWSVNIGDDISYVFNALKDEDCVIDSSGYATIVMAQENEAIKNRCKALGFNFMEWNITRDRAFIIYRNMLSNPAFSGHFNQVSPLPEGANYVDFEANTQIGEYAPKGFRMKSKDFLKEFTETD